PFRERYGLPLCLCCARALQHAADLRIGRERPFDVDPAVDRRDGFLCFGHITIKSSPLDQNLSPRRTQRGAKDREGNGQYRIKTDDSTYSCRGICTGSRKSTRSSFAFLCVP